MSGYLRAFPPSPSVYQVPAGEPLPIGENVITGLSQPRRIFIAGQAMQQPDFIRGSFVVKTTGASPHGTVPKYL